MKGIRKARKAAAQKITEMRLGQKGQETAAHPKIPAEPPIQGMAARPEIPGLSQYREWRHERGKFR